jgi:CheY-like chemotaxis protein
MTNGARIMVIDNDADIKAFLDHVQNSHDAIWLPGGGIAAQKRLNQIDYEVDAIITDLALDDIDGISLTEYIRRNESIRNKPQSLVFWMTAYPISQTLENLKAKYKVTEIFMKPLEPVDMIEKVKAYLAIAYVAVQ